MSAENYKNTSKVDPDGLLEYSVVFTDRSLNSMSKKFQTVMNEISASLKKVYGANGVAIIPGGGTFAMEAVARQFGGGKKCMIVRNGWFSFRWSQIFEVGNFAASVDVMMARHSQANSNAPFAPIPIDELVQAIKTQKPDVVFAPHVETSAGMILPDDYLSAIGEAVGSYGGLFVLDCIASGAIWVDMQKCGVDVLISAPQKGWSSSPAAGLVMFSERAIEVQESTQSSSFACDLKKWYEIMVVYENGGHAYHATMPTDSLVQFNQAIKETQSYGLEKLKRNQWDVGNRVRELLVAQGCKSVAAAGFQAPGVVVSYTDDPSFQNGSKFAEQGMQIAAGVPLRCDEPDDFKTFRIGLFGLDKLKNVDQTVATFNQVLDAVSA